MRVIYNVGVMARVAQFGYPPTGIHRVAVGLFRALLQRTDVEVIGYSQTAHQGAMEFLGREGGRALGLPKWSRALSAVLLPRARLAPLFAAMGNQSPGHRLRRRGALLVDQMLGRLVGVRETQPAADVYFDPGLYESPGYAFLGRRNAVFLHDALPTLLPECFTGGQIRVFDELVRWIRSKNPVILTSTESVRAELEELLTGIANAPVAIGMGCDAAFHPPSSEERRRIQARYGLRDRLYFVTVATLEPRKNARAALRLFSLLRQRERFRDFRMLLIGAHGWKVAEVLQGEGDRTVGADGIDFTGFLPDQEVRALLGGAAAAISLSIGEGFNLPLVEAVRCGCPVVASDLPVHREVTGGGAIFVSTRGDHDDALCVEAALGEAGNLNLRMLEAQRWASRYSWEQMGDAFVETMSSLS